MKRIWRLWTLMALLGFLIPSGAHADSSLVLGEILKKVETNYQEMQALTATFRQSTTSAAASAMTTEAVGKLFYQRPRQMRWEYETPEPQVFVANHDLAWLYVPSEKQISLYDAQQFFTSPLARTFFDGVVELHNHFDITLDSKQSNDSVAVLKLVPKKEDPSVQSLFLWIDLSTYRIGTIETHDVMGNTNRIVLDAQRPVAHLDSKLFELDVPPSTAVVDIDGRPIPPAEIDRLKQKLLPRK